MQLKLVFALAFVAVCSASSLTVGGAYYSINVQGSQIVVADQEGRQVNIIGQPVGQYGQQYGQYYGQYYGQIYGQQYGSQYGQSIRLLVDGPEMPAQYFQYYNSQVSNAVSQSDILYQIFNQYSGQLNQELYTELLSVVQKYVENGEIHPAVLYALQYVYYQSPQYLSMFNSAENASDLSQIIYPQSSSKLGYMLGLGGLNQYYGSYQQQYPSLYGGMSYKNLANNLPYAAQYGGYYGPYSSSIYQYGGLYQPYSSRAYQYTGSYMPYSSSSYQYGGIYRPYSNSAYQYGAYYSPYTSNAYSSLFGLGYGSKYPVSAGYLNQY